MTVASSPLDAIRKRAQNLRRALEALARDVDVLSAISKNDPISAARILSADIPPLEHAVSSLMTRIQGVLPGITRQAEEHLESWEQALSRELTLKGHSVFGESGLLIVDGIVHVELDRARAQVSINDARFDDLSIASMTDSTLEELTRLRKALTPPEELLDRLLTAYERELRITERPAGAQVETGVLLLQIALLRQSQAFRSSPRAAHFRDYPHAMFRADLYTLLSSASDVVRGRRFRFASGSDTAGAVFMFVPSLGRTAHVGRLWFEAAER